VRRAAVGHGRVGLGATLVVLLLGACDDPPGTSLRVSVTGRGLVRLASLGLRLGYDDTDPGPATELVGAGREVALPADLVVRMPDRATNVEVALAGFDTRSRPVAAAGLVRIAPEEQTRLTLALVGAGAFGAELDIVPPAGFDLGVPSCADGKQDGDETAVDCGGSCLPCADGLGCLGPSDCLSSDCGAGGWCRPASCGAITCGPNERCAAGSCDCAGQQATGQACARAQVCCPAGCVTISTDTKNCGACGRACGPGETCLGGACTCGTGGQGCPLGTRCDGGACVCDATSCSGCCRIDRGSPRCEPGDGPARCGAGGAACIACDALADACALGSCSCAATRELCPSGYHCTTTGCAPDGCEALNQAPWTSGTWWTSEAGCAQGCAAPARCLRRTDCGGRPCPNGECWRCI
jgi:hypothetical protein